MKILEPRSYEEKQETKLEEELDELERLVPQALIVVSLIMLAFTALGAYVGFL
jgi:hypothetical protein